MREINIKKTSHYRKYHEKNVPWSKVLMTIFTAKKKTKSKDIFEYKSDTFYVLCKREKDVLMVINAKRLKK